MADVEFDPVSRVTTLIARGFHTADGAAWAKEEFAASGFEIVAENYDSALQRNKAHGE